MILFCLFEDVIILVCGASKLKNRNVINEVLHSLSMDVKMEERFSIGFFDNDAWAMVLA